MKYGALRARHAAQVAAKQAVLLREAQQRIEKVCALRGGLWPMEGF